MLQIRPHLTLQHQMFLNLGESCITVPMAANEKARIALSSFVRSLHELESYAVARLVPKDGKDIQMLLLAPSIEPDLEALIDIPLPFAEDVRIYRFPPLDRVITTSGATLTTHRYLPSEDLMDSMSAYVDSMDISSFGKDEDGYVFDISCKIVTYIEKSTSGIYGYRRYLFAIDTPNSTIYTETSCPTRRTR